MAPISNYLRGKALETIAILDKEANEYTQKMTIKDVPGYFVTSSKEQAENVAFLEKLTHEGVEYYVCQEIRLS